jgi:hypothetical protein
MGSASTCGGSIVKVLPAILAALGGCVTVGTYPGDWPADEGGQIGKCPNIAGAYNNVGVHHPPEAKPLTLTQVFGLQDGDRVLIDQSPDAISVVVSRSGAPVETVVFTSGEINFYGMTGWDTSRPRTFSCLLNVPDFQHRLSFSHLMRSSVGGVGGFGAGVVAASGKSVHFTKGTDGSLILHFTEGWGALIGVVPVGYSEQFWIRFPPAAP